MYRVLKSLVQYCTKHATRHAAKYMRFSIGAQVLLFESFSPQRLSLYCSLMFGSEDLDCQRGQNDVGVVKKIATLMEEDAGGGRLQVLLLAYPRHEAILFH